LHYAVRGGKLPLLKLLLERGAKPDALAYLAHMAVYGRS
jgi:ankyrin repeat protein